MEYVYYFVLITILFTYCGLGLTLLIIPPIFKKYSLLFSPVVGICYVISLGWYLFSLDFGGSDIYAPIIFLLPAIFLYLYIYFQRRNIDQFSPTPRLLNKEFLPLIIVSIFSLFLLSIPYIFTFDGLVGASLGNNDIAIYSTISKYVKEFARTDSTGFIGQSNIRWHGEEGVFGAFFVTAFTSSMFSLNTYQVQSVIPSVFLFFGILIFFVLAKNVFTYNNTSATLISALYGLNPIFYYLVYHGFFSQIITTNLLIAILIIHYTALQKCKTFYDYLPYLPIAILLNFAVTLTYPHMLILGYLPIIGFLMAVSYSSKSTSKITKWVFFVSIIFLATTILSPFRAKAFINYLIWATVSQPGWHMPIFTPDTFYGVFVNMTGFYPVGMLSMFTRVTISLVILIFIIQGFINSYKNDRNIFLLVFTATSIVGVGYLILAFSGYKNGGIGGYKSFKLASIFLPLILLSTLIIFKNITFSISNKKNVLLLLAMTTLVSANFFSAIKSSSFISRHAITINKDIAELEKYDAYPNVKSINVIGISWWNILWSTNFLLRKTLYFSTATYYPASNLDGDWDLNLIAGNTKPSFIEGYILFDNAKSVYLPINSTYKLTKGANTLSWRLGAGWHPPEKSHVWSGADPYSFTIILNSTANNVVIDFNAIYTSLNINNSLVVYLNDYKVAEPGNTSCQIKDLALLKGENVLKFKASLPASPPSNGDPRNLGYALTKIEIQIKNR